MCRDNYEFRDIRIEESNEAVAIEQICFPPHEACSESKMKARIERAPEMFMVAIAKESGEMAGFLNGLSTNEEKFRDEFFLDATLYNPQGKNVMILGLDVLPAYRNQGLARLIMQEYIKREKEKGRESLILTCHETLVEMYKKMGYRDKGKSESTWGNEVWHEMVFSIQEYMYK